MRVLLCGGGTAGHVMPAIAIAEIIEKSFPGSEIAFAGRIGGAENEAYLKTKHHLYTVDICGLTRSLSVTNIKSLFKVIKSSRIAREIIEEFGPDVIIGTGGYVSYPFIRQGQRLKIKTVIHESNASPGLVTRLLGPKCDKLLLNLKGTKNHLKKASDVLVVGNPTRKKFTALSKSEARRRLGIGEDRKMIVSFGGSLGAEALNKAIFELMKSADAWKSEIYHVHATGRSHYEKLRQSYTELFTNRKNLKIVPYIEDMPTYLLAADMAITRSGAITVSELSKCALPSILIPSPNVTANHQYANAEYMQNEGAAILIEEKNLNVQRLEDEIQKILFSKENMTKMSANARRISPKNTELLIAEALLELINC